MVTIPREQFHARTAPNDAIRLSNPLGDPSVSRSEMLQSRAVDLNPKTGTGRDSTNILLLDRTLKFYGTGAKEARNGLRDAIVQTHNRIWSREGVRPENLDSTATQKSVNASIEQLLTLSPKTDAERMMQSRAVQESEAISQSRLLMFEQLGGSIPWPFLTVLVFWICVLFIGFGLFARFNTTVTVALLVGALSVAGAIFLILELNDPYHGLMRISDEPLRNAIGQIDQ